MIVAKVYGSLKEDHFIDLYSDGNLVASVWGRAKVKKMKTGLWSGYCMLLCNKAGDLLGWFYPDKIERVKWIE